MKYPALVAALTLTASSWAGDVERPSALDGSQYAIVAPIYDGTAGSISYLRLFNGGPASTSFNVTVVNAANGLTLGNTSISVPPNASPQYPVTSAGGGNSIFAQAGVGASGGSYALYVQDTDAAAGYQHVTYNGVTALFENNSVCQTPIDAQLASSQKQVLTNVHTTVLAGYPSTISIHNYSATPSTTVLTGYDAATGTNIGATTLTVPANGTLTLPENQFESSINYHPTSAQPHINIAISTPTGAVPSVRATQTIHNSQLGGDINMGETCAINAVAPSVVQVAPSVPVAYCGTVHSTTSSAPYSISGNFTASVAPDGTMIATSFALTSYGGLLYVSGGYSTGHVSGNTFTLTSASGGTATGTIQNGVLTGTATSSTSSGTISGSTSACN